MQAHRCVPTVAASFISTWSNIKEEKGMNLLMRAKISGIFVFVVLFLKCS